MTSSAPPETSSAPQPPPQALTSIDGNRLHHMFGAGFAWLKQHSHIVNALNVFPVPDGDTGTNMVLTMKSAWKAAAQHSDDGVGDVIQAIANGAIRGARGNSGVILSQILRGMAENLRDVQQIAAERFAEAMGQARVTAYKGVLKPVEGTILTVIREAADACGHAAAINPDIRFVLETTLAKAQQALDNTPNLLPVLKQAGVVDAGGQGLFYLFEGMAKYLRGEHLPEPEAVADDAGLVAMPAPNLDALGEEEWGYDIQYLIFGDDLDEDRIRQELMDMGGESVVVGKAGSVVKVHVHNENPGPFISYGASLGYLDDIVLENMTLQTLRRKGEWNEDGPVTEGGSATTPVATPPGVSYKPDCPGIVAVASGDGLQKVFESLGVCSVVAGGQTMNPSTEELLGAAEELPHDEVIILPNNKNIILSARQAAELSTKTIHVIETRSMPQGISAMLGYNADNDAKTNVAAMRACADDVHTAEITTAVRTAHFDHIDVQPGDIIAIVDGQLQVKGDDVDEVVLRTLNMLDPDEEAEIVTLYYGEPVSRDAAAALVARLEAAYPDLEIELHHGGQPHYHYLISSE